MALNDLECQLFCRQSVVTKRLRLESRGLRYEVALYLSYLHIKFDYEFRGKSF